MYFIASGLDWTTSEIIDNSTFKNSPHKTFFVKEVSAEFAEVPDYIARRNTEIVLERIRQNHFALKPSRGEAIFLNKSATDAKRWRDRGSRSAYSVYELKIIEEINSCEANFIWYNYSVRLHANPVTEHRGLFAETVDEELVRSANAYWLNEPTEAFGCPSEVEVLFVGRLEVVKKVA